MTAKIRILPEQLCNTIAAGEVVERPASVVKELVENSLDAAATEIRIDVEGGGRRLIRVGDNGIGMVRDDVLLCLERHATSKIQVAEDLFRLCTFGFRGEALPSIAAVSRFTLRSRAADAEEGWEVYAEGGAVRRSGAVGLSAGTTVEVRDLFFNLPVRRKFLRKEETELGHVGDVVTKLALSRPQVRFSLVHSGRPLIEVYRHATLEERVAALLGRQLLEQMLPLAARGEGGLRLHGLIGQPAASRATSGTIYTFINGRFIRDRVVQHAIMEGYRHLLERGRYPAAVLFLEIEPALVDVNVHPTKHEVRFRDQGLVHDFIATAVRDLLRPAGWLAATAALRAETPVPTVEGGGDESAGADPADGARLRVQEALLAYARRQPEAVPAIAPPVIPDVSPPSPPFILPPVSEPAGEPGFFAALQVLGQYRRSFILCQDGDDLILIDQHAAHERIGFERLRGEFGRGGLERQSLLFPEMIELDFREAAVLSERLAALERFGFEVEPFGGRTFALKAVPRLLAAARPERLLRDVAAELAVVGRSALAEEAVEAVLAVMACHGMVRANQALTPAEIAALLRDLDRVDFRAHCPHGRPVMKRLTLGEVERMFRRS